MREGGREGGREREREREEGGREGRWKAGGLLLLLSSFPSSSFLNNTSQGETEDTSAIAAFRFPITFGGTNSFINNLGGGVTLLNTQMKASGVMVFENNTAVFGGGIAMDDRCLVTSGSYTCVYMYM